MERRLQTPVHALKRMAMMSSFPCGVALAAGFALAVAGAPWVQAAVSGPLTVADAWTRAAGARQNGAGYLSITNRGRIADRLIAASSAAATHVSIHESRMVGSVATMRAVGAVAIPGGATVAFRPGGLHLMLEGLKRPLKVGERVTVILIFARAGRRAAVFSVRDGQPAPAMPGMKM